MNEIEQEQERQRFDSMMLKDHCCWMPKTYENNKLKLSLGTVIHYIYIYGTFDMSETCTVGENSVRYHGNEIATFEMSEKYKIPVFVFNEEYNWMNENQTIFLNGLDNELDEKWKNKFNYFK